MRRVVLASLALAGCGPASPPAAPEHWIGCYAIARGEWDRAPENLMASEPGAWLHLLLDQPPAPEFYGGPPLPGASQRHLATSASGQGIWWLRTPDSVSIVVGGLVGVELQLARGGQDSLTGTATVFTDMLDQSGQRKSSRAPVTATVSPCNSAA